MVNILRYCTLIGCILLSNMTFASLDKDLWPKWEATNPTSQKVISHQAWQDFLNRRLITNNEGINLIDYPNITKEDINHLNQYINQMATVPISEYNRQEQLAYWINLYNALTVQTILNHYPVESIQEIKISPGLFSIGPWGAHLITINGMRLTLDDIHNRIIRPIWNDARTHYAINNGSMGAANLSTKAYQSATLEPQLNQAATDYINSLRGIQIIEGKLVASKIYKWFYDDFGGNDIDLINHLKQYANKPLRMNLNQIKRVSTYNYNWHLNGVPAA